MKQGRTITHKEGGMTFYIEEGVEIPLEVCEDALIVFKNGVFAYAIPGDRERVGRTRDKWHPAISTVRRLIRASMEERGSLKPFTREEGLRVVRRNTRDTKYKRIQSKEWIGGFVIQQHFGDMRWGSSMRIQLDGKKSTESVRFWGDCTYVLDDDAGIDALNEAEQAVTDALIHLRKIKDKYLRPLPRWAKRAELVKERTKQKRRQKHKKQSYARRPKRKRTRKAA